MPIDELKNWSTSDPKKIVRKINEMIQFLNMLETHYHESLDTRYFTTLPKYSEKQEGDEEP